MNTRPMTPEEVAMCADAVQECFDASQTTGEQYLENARKMDERNAEKHADISAAMTRINQSDVSASCKSLARESLELFINHLGPCSVFWDTEEDSITFEAMHHPSALVVYGQNAGNEG